VTPDEYCRDKATPGGSSLSFALARLPARRRRAATALHALRQELDDVVAGCADAQLARTRLAWWRTEVGRLFEGSPGHPVTRALQPGAAEFGITAAALNDFITGVEDDLAQTRYLDYAAVERHCRSVAGTLGLLAAGVFGYRDPRTAEHARLLGIATQLARIACEVGAQARRNRIYLPMDELRKFDVPASDILEARHSERFSALMKYQCERAHAMFARALGALPPEDRASQRAGLVIAALGRATLVEVARDGFRVLTHRTSLTPLRKWWISWTTWAAG